MAAAQQKLERINKSMPEATRRQRLTYEKALYRYINALDRGDIDTVLDVLQEAESDQMLEQMIFETHAEYPMEETMQPDIDTAQGQHPQAETTSQEAPTNRRPQSKKKRWPMTVQLLCAIFVALILVSGSWFVFQAYNRLTSLGSNDVFDPKTAIIITATNSGQLVAHSNDNGKVIWQEKIPYNGPADPTISTPGLVIQQHIVYVAYRGYAQALQISNGKVLWTNHVATFPNTITNSYFSYPRIMADQNNIYISGITSNDSGVYVLNAKTGTMNWSSSSPSILLAINEGIIYTSNGKNNAIIALNSITGKQIWSYTASLPQNAVVANNVLYVQLHQQPSPNKPTGTSNDPLLALNSTTGELIWSVTTNSGQSALSAGPITVADGIIVLSNTETLCGYRTSDGDQVWCQKKAPKSDGNEIISEQAQIRIANGTIYNLIGIASSNQVTLKMQATSEDNGKTLWTNQLFKVKFPGAAAVSSADILPTGKDSAIATVGAMEPIQIGNNPSDFAYRTVLLIGNPDGKGDTITNIAIGN
jgi:outer membrane protein assembly factor BamB